MNSFILVLKLRKKKQLDFYPQMLLTTLIALAVAAVKNKNKKSVFLSCREPDCIQFLILPAGCYCLDGWMEMQKI